jgi:UbiD family decarboxylase
MARITDLREYLRALESLNDVEHIDRPVSAVLEVAAITRRSTERGWPAPLFDNIQETGPGFRMLGAPGSLSSDRRCRTTSQRKNWSSTWWRHTQRPRFRQN